MPRLLVVESYLPLATVIGIGLRRAGHDVVRVGNAERALRAEGTFALLVIDLDLPDGDGLEVAERLLAAGTIASVVFYTASRDTARRQQAERMGAVVDKGVKFEQLLEVVCEMLAEDVPDELAMAVPDATVSQRESGRSGTRRRIR